MQKKIILASILLTIFLDFFNLGLIYPIFTAMIFEGMGDIISANADDFQKNTLYGFLISAFPFGQFLGAPVIGQLSDHFGRRKLLLISLIGTVAALFICSFGVYFSNLSILFLGRLFGGLMAGNMTLAYASLADFSSPEDKIKNFALIPLVTGLGFVIGPYLAGILGNPGTYTWSGPTVPFTLAAILSFLNFLLVYAKFPETSLPRIQTKLMNCFFSSLANLWKAFRKTSLRPYLFILFFMISTNFVFVQFIGSFAIERFHIDLTQIGYLYATLGISVAFGHMFLTRNLAAYFLPVTALKWSLIIAVGLILGLVFIQAFIWVHVLGFFIMCTFAVAYTNAMAIVSNQAPQDQQGEVMGVAVSIQSCAEFLPASLIGMIAFLSEALPLIAAMLFAIFSLLILSSTEKLRKLLAKGT